MSQPMPIPKITTVVTECWMQAETETRTRLANHHPDEDEEFITKLFQGEFRSVVEKSNNSGDIKTAFLHDIETQFPSHRNSSELLTLANDISATVTFHPKMVEGTTKGDLGITFVRPNITANSSNPLMLDIDDNYQRGLLCQAKIKRRPSKNKKSKWGSFDKEQKDIVNERSPYLALLLYEYIDIQRKNLKSFGWQLCGGAKFKDIIKWLSEDTFPDRTTSETIISCLGNDIIGTKDKDIIKQFINPDVRSSLIIKIGWPKPPGQVYVTNNIQQEQKKQIKLKLRSNTIK